MEPVLIQRILIGFKAIQDKLLYLASLKLGFLAKLGKKDFFAFQSADFGVVKGGSGGLSIVANRSRYGELS